MAWDDTPPKPQELQTSNWDSAPPTWQELNGNKGIFQRFKEGATSDIKGLGGLIQRTGQGLLDLPQDIYETGKTMMNGGDANQTPLMQDARTVGGAITNVVPHVSYDSGNPTDISKYRFEPGAAITQMQDIGAEPLKYIPGQVGQQFQKAYPENQFVDHPINTALALAPLAKPIFGAAAEGAGEALQGSAQNFGRRALGLSKRFLNKTEDQLPAANQAAQSALDNGVIQNPILHPFSSGAKDMLDRAQALDTSTGQQIGSYLKSQGTRLDPYDPIQRLEDLRGKLPADDAISNQINNAQDIIAKISDRYPDYLHGGEKFDPSKMNPEYGFNMTKNPANAENYALFNGGQVDRYSLKPDAKIISRQELLDQLYPGWKENKSGGSGIGDPTVDAHLVQKAKEMGYDAIDSGSNMVGVRVINPDAVNQPGIPFEEANRLKSYLQKKVNWNSDKATAETGQKIAGVMRGSIDDQLGQIAKAGGAGEGFDQFLQNKKLFGQTQIMQKGLLNKTAGESGNLPVSPYSLIAGSDEFMKGNAFKALMVAGGTELVKRYGSATAATMADSLSKLLLKDPSKYTALAENALSTGAASVETLSNALKIDPEFQQLAGQKKTMFKPGQSPKPFFKKAAQLPDDQMDPNLQDAKSVAWSVSQPDDSTAKPVDLSIPQRVARTVPQTPQAKKYLDEETARMYLDKANGSKAKARAMANQDGYTVV